MISLAKFTKFERINKLQQNLPKFIQFETNCQNLAQVGNGSQNFAKLKRQGKIHKIGKVFQNLPKLMKFEKIGKFIHFE